jgi:hypothetical protein
MFVDVIILNTMATPSPQLARTATDIGVATVRHNFCRAESNNVLRQAHFHTAGVPILFQRR